MVVPQSRHLGGTLMKKEEEEVQHEGLSVNLYYKNKLGKAVYISANKLV